MKMQIVLFKKSERLNEQKTDKRRKLNQFQSRLESFFKVRFMFIYSFAETEIYIVLFMIRSGARTSTVKQSSPKMSHIPYYCAG